MKQTKTRNTATTQHSKPNQLNNQPAPVAIDLPMAVSFCTGNDSIITSEFLENNPNNKIMMKLIINCIYIASFKTDFSALTNKQKQETREDRINTQ